MHPPLSQKERLQNRRDSVKAAVAKLRKKKKNQEDESGLQKRFDEACYVFAAKNNIPVNVFSSDTFRDLIKIANPKLKVSF